MTLTHASTLCPTILIDIVNRDGSLLDDGIFEFERNINTFKINTRDTTLANTYRLSLIANFIGNKYSQSGELQFKVNLIDYCGDSTLTNPIQAATTDPTEYLYEGTASFNLIPMVITPSECIVTYSCEEKLLGLCDFSDGTTIAEFNINSGDYSFISSDISIFGTQTITFTITGIPETAVKSADSTETND